MNRLVLGRDRWFESAGVKKDDYKGLADLVLKEKIYESCSTELVTFLKERNPKTTNDIVGLAEQFQTAHLNATLSKQPSLCAMSTKFQERQSRTMDREQDRTRYASAPNYFRRKQYRNIRQPFRPKPHASQSSVNYRPRTPNQYGNVRPQFQSHFCKPRQQDSRTLNQVRQQFGPRINKKANLSSSLSGDESNIPLFKGLISNIECSFMRDTGCSMSAASASKVLHSQMTNEKVECTLINGQTITQPTAIVDAVTPFYEGSIEVLVFTNCVADLILGNDIDPNTLNKIQSLRNDKHDDHSNTDSYLKHITAPVTTRSQTAKTNEKDRTTIKNSEEKTSKTNDHKSKSHSNNQEKSHIFGKFSKEAFKQAQEQDKSLSKLKYLASNGISGYAYEDGLLIRRFENKIDNQISIIVPSCLRIEVLKLAHDSDLPNILA